MEEAEVAAQETAGGPPDPAECQTGESTRAGSSLASNPGSECKMAEKKEPRCSRLKLFDKVMQKSMEKFIELTSFDRFASIFRPLYKNPQTMENIYKQFKEELRRAIQEDISRLIEEGRLESKLTELDQLESAACNNPEPAWRPQGVPEQDFSSFLKPYYEKQEAYMRRQLKKIQAENAALAQKVQDGRQSIAQTEHCISAAVAEWKASVAEMESVSSSLSPEDVFDV